MGTNSCVTTRAAQFSPAAVVRTSHCSFSTLKCTFVDKDISSVAPEDFAEKTVRCSPLHLPSSEGRKQKVQPRIVWACMVRICRGAGLGRLLGDIGIATASEVSLSYPSLFRSA